MTTETQTIILLLEQNNINDLLMIEKMDLILFSVIVIMILVLYRWLKPVLLWNRVKGRGL